MRLNMTLLAALLVLTGLLAACSSESSNVSDEAAVNDAEQAAQEQEPAADADADTGTPGVPADDPGAIVGEGATVDLGDEAEVAESGLQVLETEVGEGPAAERCDTLTMHYTGTLASGHQFDGSVERGKPFQFTLGAGEVIQGWDEGLAGMQVGGRRTLAIPPELGYGSQAKGDIPPNSQLLFDVEMLDLFQRPELPNGPSVLEAMETAPSGLQYAILDEGDGEEAASGDAVLVHYAGWLPDGTLFDSSLNPDRCEPFMFALGQGMVIPGWDAGVAGMKVGERRQLVIPPDLAYGADGYGPIPPDSTLTFEVELVGIR